MVPGRELRLIIIIILFLQCELAKISQESQRNGILLGYAKEVADYVKKRSNGQNRKAILEDSRKDLQNNMYGSKLGE